MCLLFTFIKIVWKSLRVDFLSVKGVPENYSALSLCLTDKEYGWLQHDGMSAYINNMTVALLTVMWELHCFLVCVTMRVNRLITHRFFMMSLKKHLDTSRKTLDKQNMSSHWIIPFYSILYSHSIDPHSYKQTRSI